MSKNLLTNHFSEPLNGAITARIDIHAGEGNLTIDKLTSGDETVLVSGASRVLREPGSTCTEPGLK